MPKQTAAAAPRLQCRPLLCTVHEAVPASGRSSLVCIDVELTMPSEVAFVTFRNFYTAAVLLQVQVAGSGDAWRTVVSWKQLMDDPHHEDDAQVMHTISTALDWDQAALQSCSSPLCALRLWCEQPSPVWQSHGLHDVQVYQLTPEAVSCSAVTAAVASPRASAAGAHEVMERGQGDAASVEASLGSVLSHVAAVQKQLTQLQQAARNTANLM